MASIEPRGSSSGSPQRSEPVQRGHRPSRHERRRTARRPAPRPAPGGPSTRSASSRSSRTLVSQVTRRSRGSTRRHLEVGPADRPGVRPGRPAPEPMSMTRDALGQQVGQHGAVQDVPLPEPRHLARADQPVGDPGRAEVADVALGQRQPVTEDRRCGRRRAGGTARLGAASSGFTWNAGFTWNDVRTAGRRRAGSARRPRTRSAGPARRRRRGRPCARTGLIGSRDSGSPEDLTCSTASPARATSASRRAAR